ncbi:hypothetical protein [uncultured Sulfitobacter sp.]|uniref:hypothetical protein n=1 Tax=uncultured Sulfitobacter sp. TaxID=191468 RepID=UPI0026329B28|nr:hypothetical protein [uncultured Sulfitobacter sp.]
MSETPSDRLSKLGVKATLFYLVLLFGGVPLMAYFSIIELAPLKLSELGDFLAGAFGPLAIFWLILGFFQQGNELRNSIATLELQAEELANSVKQQKELVAVTRETLDHERELVGLSERNRKASLQPVLEVSFATSMRRGDQQFKYKLQVVNAGASVTRFSGELIIPDGKKLFISSTHYKNGDVLTAESNEFCPAFEDDMLLKVTYFDLEGDNFEGSYRIVCASMENGWPKYMSHSVG